jgi:methionyl-tRNA formyltransferase
LIAEGAVMTDRETPNDADADDSDASDAPAAKQTGARSSRISRLVLMGTGPFAVPSFEALVNAGYTIPLVVTRPAREVKSRKGPPPSPVREFAAKHGFDLFDPPSINSSDAISRVAAAKPDLLVVCDFGQILSSDALAVAPLGGINLHGSLLPAYRGAAPVQWALLSGDTVTGVSVIHMTPRLDGGPILAKAETAIRDDETSGELEHRLSLLGVEPTLASVEMLDSWDGQAMMGQPQDATRVSRAPRLDKASGKIDWSRSMRMIDCHVRGMQPWPGAYTDLAVPGSDKPPLRIAIRAVKPVEGERQSSDTPGTVVSDKELLVACADGLIRIDRLQVAGRSEVSAEEFLRGHRLPIGTVLG